MRWRSIDPCRSRNEARSKQIGHGKKQRARLPGLRRSTAPNALEKMQRRTAKSETRRLTTAAFDRRRGNADRGGQRQRCLLRLMNAFSGNGCVAIAAALSGRPRTFERLCRPSALAATTATCLLRRGDASKRQRHAAPAGRTNRPDKGEEHGDSEEETHRRKF